MMGPISAGDASGIYALLAALADPQATKQRLDELLHKQQELEQKEQDIAAKRRELDGQAKEINAGKTARERAVADLAQREQVLQEREQSLQRAAREHAHNLTAHEAQMRERREAFDKAEAEYSGRLRQLQQDRAVVDRELRDAHEKQRVATLKLDKLREIQTAGE